MSEPGPEFDVGWDYNPIWCLCCDGEMLQVTLPEGRERLPYEDYEGDEGELESPEESQTELEAYYQCAECGWTIYATDYDWYKGDPSLLPCG